MDGFLAILVGVPLTLYIAASSFLIGAVVAVPLVLALRSKVTVLRVIVRGLVDLLRGVPIVVWLFILYYGISIGTFRFDSVSAAIVGLGLIAAAYLAEVYRGAILSIPEGQWEASNALGFSRVSTFSLIIAPQALRVALPSATTFGIALLKDSSIASVIGVTEIVFLTQAEARSNQSGLEMYIIAAVVYIALSFPLGLLSRWLDARFRKAVVA